MRHFASILAVSLCVANLPAAAQQVSKPNIILIVSDDFGYGDAGAYGGGERPRHADAEHRPAGGRGHDFYSFYAQPSCTPGRAAMQTGRIPNRSGMTTVAFQGQGGGLACSRVDARFGAEDRRAIRPSSPASGTSARPTTPCPTAQGYDEMKYAGLYHLNAYTYADPTWFPDMDPELRAMFQQVTKGALSGNAGEPAREDFKINGQYVNTPGQGVVGIPFFDDYVEKASLDYLDQARESAASRSS